MKAEKLKEYSIIRSTFSAICQYYCTATSDCKHAMWVHVCIYLYAYIYLYIHRNPICPFWIFISTYFTITKFVDRICDTKQDATKTDWTNEEGNIDGPRTNILTLPVGTIPVPLAYLLTLLHSYLLQGSQQKRVPRENRKYHVTDIKYISGNGGNKKHKENICMHLLKEQQ